MSVLNNTTSPAIRTGLQGAVSAGIIRLIEVVPEPDLVIDQGDQLILLAVIAAVVSLVQNFIENHLGHSLLIPQRTDPLMPETADDRGHGEPWLVVAVAVLAVIVLVLVL